MTERKKGRLGGGKGSRLSVVLSLLLVFVFLILVDVVEKEDVNEAMRLTEMSKDSLTHNNEKSGRAQTVTDKIFTLICEVAGDGRVIKLAEVLEQCTSKGYKPDQVNECIEEYEELNVWHVNQARTKLMFV